MAQLERFPPRQVNASRSLTSPTVEKALRGGEFSKGSPTSNSPISPLSEDDNGAPQKKSVLSKVKEKAKKLRHSLSKKKHDDGNITPAWGVSAEDEEEEEEEDAEYLGAPMYESELAPEAYKENARQHPRATPVIAENHVLHNPLKSRGEMDRQKPLSGCTESKRTTHHHHHLAASTSSLASNKTMTGNAAEKLAPAYTKASSDTGLCISSKMQGLTVSKHLDTQTPSLTPAPSRKSPLSVTTTNPLTPPAKTASKLSPVASKAPRFSSAPSTPRKSSPSASSTLNMKNATAGPGDQTWDKGVSVREYFKNKLEPGEDEKALSQVISDAMSPRRTPGDVGVMEKVREAVTSLLRNEEPPQYSVRSPTLRASSQNHVLSSNVQQVAEEENHGRILQTN
ncbi:uncharacterized protein LOC114761894 [Neltuma alba]|uniref:uncharacterized protein LOC114761894 n=1 Tax=Neltuma alba TaxID=207710 RepID=UPI0010A407A5|nr:uncharacterized protein LOC114761894 [Prosopis alba]